MKRYDAVAPRLFALITLSLVGTIAACDQTSLPTEVRSAPLPAMRTSTLSGPVVVTETTDLGTLGGNLSIANAISANGNITGLAALPGGACAVGRCRVGRQRSIARAGRKFS